MIYCPQPIIAEARHIRSDNVLNFARRERFSAIGKRQLSTIRGVEAGSASVIVITAAHHAWL
jgi:hypothetical protein